MGNSALFSMIPETGNNCKHARPRIMVKEEVSEMELLHRAPPEPQYWDRIIV